MERLARYFAQRYGGDNSLLEARKALDPEAWELEKQREKMVSSFLFIIGSAFLYISRLKRSKKVEGD